MGILNLLRELQPATVDTHLAAWAGHTLGVDAMGWLHRSGYSCAMELARCESDPTQPHPTGYLRWLKRMLHMCRTLGVKLIVVFDGAALPAKSGTNAARDAMRTANRARADALWASGQREAAADIYGRCVSVTPAMRRNFLHLLRSEHVPFIVAPYEADAQLAHLYLSGHISAAITEDSDLLAFGCERLLIKLDRGGNARLVSLTAVRDGQWDKQRDAMLYKLRRILREHRNEEEGTAATAASSSSSSHAAAASSNPVPPVPSSPPSRCVGHARFLHACVLSGCDYLVSLHGVGLKRSVSLVDNHRLLEPLLYFLKDARKKIEAKWKADNAARAKQQLRDRRAMAAGGEEGNGDEPTAEEEEAAIAAAAADDTAKMSTADYIAHLYRALLTFQHQLVFDPDTRSIVHLTPLPPQLQQLWDESMARSTARDSPAPAAASASPSPPTLSRDGSEVLVLDSDEEGEQESKQGGTIGAATSGAAAAPRITSAAFPTFRDVTDATAAYAAYASSGFHSALWPPALPASHPLLQQRSFSFLGSPLPSHVSVTEWTAGRIDPRTMRPYTPGFVHTDADAPDTPTYANGKQQQQQQQQQGKSWKRWTSTGAASNTTAATASPPAGKGAISNFFARSASASPFTTAATTASGASPAASAAPRKPFSLVTPPRSTVPPAPSTQYRLSASLVAATQQSADMDDLFGGGSDLGGGSDPHATLDDGDEAALRELHMQDDADAAEAAAALAVEVEDGGIMDALRRQDEEDVGHTQPLDSESEETSQNAKDAAVSTVLPAPISPSLNPFARPLRSVDTATFADFDDTATMRARGVPNSDTGSTMAAITPSRTVQQPSPSSSSFVSKIFGPRPPARTPVSAAVAAAAAVLPPRDPCTPSKKGDLRPLTQVDVCDLSNGGDEDQGGGQLTQRTQHVDGKSVQADGERRGEHSNDTHGMLKRKTSAPPSASPTPARCTQASPPLKRQKSSPAAPAPAGSLLSFFRKSS